MWVWEPEFELENVGCSSSSISKEREVAVALNIPEYAYI